jgi:hypothetical protein
MRSYEKSGDSVELLSKLKSEKAVLTVISGIILWGFVLVVAAVTFSATSRI